MVQKLVPKPLKKVVKPPQKLGVRLYKNPPTRGSIQYPAKSSSGYTTMPVQKIKGISYTLPSYGTGGNPNSAFQPAPFIDTSFNPFNRDEILANQAAHYNRPEDHGIDLNPFKEINAFIEDLQSKNLWLMVVGFLVALIFILLGLYGIVSGTKQQVMSSTLGTNAHGLVNTFKGKKKK